MHVVHEYVGCIQQTTDMDHRQAFVNMVMNIKIISKVEKCIGEVCGSLLVKKKLLPYTVIKQANQLNNLAKNNFTKK
jgi:hypothetical protein